MEQHSASEGGALPDEDEDGAADMEQTGEGEGEGEAREWKDS